MTMKIEGLEGIDMALKRLGDVARPDAMEQALTKSADPFVVDYTYDAPEALRSGVRVRTVDKMKKMVAVAVGSRHPLAHIFEFGTKRRRTKEGSARGRIQKIGFARRAFDTNVGRWFTNMGRLIWVEVKRVGR